MPEIANKSDEQKLAEAEVENFRKDLGPFVVAAETTRMAMVFTDAKESDHPIIFANDAFLALTGYDREEVLGHSFNFLMARGADRKALAQVSADGGSEINYRRKDGSVFWAALFISPVRDDSGGVVQHFASFVDLSKHKHEQAQSTIMIDELNHRVKNTLATVQSIVWQALRKASDPEVIREAIESRLSALSRSHDLLTRESWEGAGLRDLVNQALEPFGVANGRAERFVITGKNIRFSPKATLALGIAFHELATNAVKYDAFSNEAGSILIVWTIKPTPEGNRLILRWQEKDGPPVTRPTRKGFGSRVLERGLAHELEGKVQLDYRPDGVVCTINIPAPRGAFRSAISSFISFAGTEGCTTITSGAVATSKTGAKLPNGSYGTFGFDDRVDDKTAVELRIGCTETMAAGFVSAVIDRISWQHPRAVFHLVPADSITLVNRELRQRGVELVVTPTAGLSKCLCDRAPRYVRWSLMPALYLVRRHLMTFI